MKKIRIKTIIMGVRAVLIVWVAIKAYQYNQPGDVPPFYYQVSGDWEAFVTSPNILREQTLIQGGSGS